MERLQRAAVLTELTDRLHDKGSWCGETHVQKAVYFLQTLLDVPTGYEFILYKHGPYSFDLTADLTGFRADFLLELDYRSRDYGPSLTSTPTSKTLRENFPRTLASQQPKLEFVAEKFGRRGVTELEKLATALFVTQELGVDVDLERRAGRIHELKPHVSQTDALSALREYEQIAKDAQSLALQMLDSP